MAKIPTPDFTGLDPLVAIIINSLPSPTDSQKDGVGPGFHDVDMTIHLRVKGQLRVGARSETSQVNLMKPWVLAKKLANHVPASVLDEILGEHIQNVRDGKGVDEDEGDLKNRVMDRLLLAGCACTIVKRGAVKLVGDVDVQVEE